MKGIKVQLYDWLDGKYANAQDPILTFMTGGVKTAEKVSLSSTTVSLITL